MTRYDASLEETEELHCPKCGGILTPLPPARPGPRLWKCEGCGYAWWPGELGQAPERKPTKP